MRQPIAAGKPGSIRQPVILPGLADLSSRKGQDLGVREWVTVTHDNIDLLGSMTRDEPWIHVDPERAKEALLVQLSSTGF